MLIVRWREKVGRDMRDLRTTFSNNEHEEGYKKYNELVESDWATNTTVEEVFGQPLEWRRGWDKR